MAEGKRSSVQGERERLEPMENKDRRKPTRLLSTEDAAFSVGEGKEMCSRMTESDSTDLKEKLDLGQ